MLSLKGQNLYLRALEPEDLDFLYTIENDEKIWEISSTITPYSRFVLKQYLEQSHRDLFEIKQLRLVISNFEDQAIGFVDLFDFDPMHKRAGIGILISNRTDRYKGYGKEVLDILINYCFDYLDLHQLFANIAVDNLASIQLFERSGFIQAGVKKDWIKTGSIYKDELLYQLINVH